MAVNHLCRLARAHVPNDYKIIGTWPIQKTIGFLETDIRHLWPQKHTCSKQDVLGGGMPHNQANSSLMVQQLHDWLRKSS